jgi:hypothetical protein
VVVRVMLQGSAGFPETARNCGGCLVAGCIASIMRAATVAMLGVVVLEATGTVAVRGEGDVVALPDATASCLFVSHAVSCCLRYVLQVFIRQGRGVAVAMAAIAKARGLLSSLYSRDCTVFSMWKGAAPEGQRLAAAAAAAVADDDNIDEEGELLLAAGEVADAAMQVAAGGSKYTQQQQQMQKEDDEGLEVDAGLMLGDVQQQQQHYWVPRQVNKLLVIACDPGDSMTAGWGQQTPLHSKTWRLRQQRQRQGEAKAGDGS